MAFWQNITTFFRQHIETCSASGVHHLTLHFWTICEASSVYFECTELRRDFHPLQPILQCRVCFWVGMISCRNCFPLIITRFCNRFHTLPPSSPVSFPLLQTRILHVSPVLLHSHRLLVPWKPFSHVNRQSLCLSYSWANLVSPMGFCSNAD